MSGYFANLAAYQPQKPTAMNHIVVGIDFSKSSVKAFEYALNVASVTGSDLKLIYVKKDRDVHNVLPEGSKGLPTSIEKGFKNLIEKNKEAFSGEISYRIFTGKIYEEVTNFAKYTESSMIIAGAHGMSGFEEFWAGNNAIKIITHANKPVITLKKNYKIKPKAIEKIVIPIDSTFETTQKVPFTIELAKKFKAQINILSLYSSRMKNIEQRVDNSTKETLALVIKSGLRHINEKAECENITQATIDYALKRNADMISIMTEQEFSSHTVVMGSYAQQMVNQSPIPVLSNKTRILVPQDAIIE